MQAKKKRPARAFVSVVGAAALGRLQTWRKAGETGRRGRRPPTGWRKKRAWCENRGRGKPLPYGNGGDWVRNVQRDVEDAVPYRR